MHNDDLTSIPIDQLDAEFTEDTEPQDDHLMQLLRLAYTQQIVCRMATIPLNRIQPFADYQPAISEAFRHYFTQCQLSNQPLSLLVYEQGDHFVMSDDYSTYMLYKESGAVSAPCTILNPTETSLTIPGVSEPFYLPLPSVDVN